MIRGEKRPTFLFLKSLRNLAITARRRSCYISVDGYCKDRPRQHVCVRCYTPGFGVGWGVGYNFIMMSVSTNVGNVALCGKLDLLYLTGQKRSMSELTCIWPVILTGKRPKIILSPDFTNSF